ncbi:glycosyltransferase family 39 protein [[Phormidium] sp. ETS-05]|uniref:ArnT family glycosyltransferase n=1 Tax=[Phormidium] sp. ETS-05 TaxID=222819 RepID=UPI0018EED578|nr:glycosyltransferase family 39 protein [[Phormidium] sp. ETS-05]
MYEEIFRLNASGDAKSPDRRWLEQLWVLGLLLAAILLYQMNLGDLPLRDWDEGIVAQVAREILRSDTHWLYPTLDGEPYFNKPPLVHALIALAYSIGGVNEWTARLPGAMLCALSVPLLYGIGRELFPLRGPAIFAALVYLTLLPVVRHGRLAMLDGAVQCFFLLMLWCLLRSRRDLRYGLGVGIGLGLLSLTKGLVILPLVSIAIIFALWDTPRLLASGYIWSGLLLGMAPAVAWYAAQWHHYGFAFISAHFLSQSWDRILSPVDQNSGPPWYYLLEILKYAWPWLLFWPYGLRLAWENRILGWGKLILVWTGVYLLVISVMSTKLPWYVLPVYPAVALACGAWLAQVWLGSDTYSVSPLNPALRRRLYPRFGVAVLALLAVAGWASSVYFGFFAHAGRALPVTLVAVALTMTVSGFLFYRQDRQFILILFWGMYVSLSLFVSSPSWVWELGEDYPVMPVAAMIQRQVPPDEAVLTDYPNHRPSLNFYSDRRVIAGATPEQIQRYWEENPQPYLLLQEKAISELNLKHSKQVAAAGGWILVTR